MRLLASLAAGLVALCLSFGAGAQTREDVVTIINAAVAHAQKVGAAQAIKDISTAPEWKAKGLSVYVQNMDGTCVAHSQNERLIGRNTMAIKDPDGKEFIKEMTEMMKSKDSGWVEYKFTNAVTKQLESRVAHIRRLPGYEGFVGAAYSK